MFFVFVTWFGFLDSVSLKNAVKRKVATNATFRDSNLVNGDDVGDESVANGEQKKTGLMLQIRGFNIEILGQYHQPYYSKEHLKFFAKVLFSRCRKIVKKIGNIWLTIFTYYHFTTVAIHFKALVTLRQNYDTKTLR